MLFHQEFKEIYIYIYVAHTNSRKSEEKELKKIQERKQDFIFVLFE